MKQKKLTAGIIFSLFFALLLILLAPEDKTLGPILKLVYLHGALIFTGLLLFLAVGLLGLRSLFSKGQSFSLLFSIERTAIIFWVAATIIGDITSVLAWGGLNWSEPRFNATIIISLVSISVYLISTAMDDPRIISVLGIGLAVSVWALMISSGKIMHPDNPFGNSEPSIRFFFGIITFVFLISSILAVSWMVEKEM
ncbi:MAG TPA: hypothetical protein VN316_01385 [candidate division Zixibacteria bacterium]|nr:hypothetical protein [candidate division Zixibacteria bacterium]